MKHIQINSLKNIQGMKFHDIEGGFGEDKKAMLVKEIANIHRRDTGKINELINKNIKRFKDEVDIVDLKGTQFDILLMDNGIYTQNALNRSENIYLLSERGYAKLLKILEDDVAWEQYEKLVDGYFNLRGQAKNETKPLGTMELIKLQIKAMEEQEVKIKVIDEKVDKLESDMPLFQVDCKELQAEVRKIGILTLGGKYSNAYKDNSLRGKVYSDIQQQIKREFGINRYEALKRNNLDKAIEIVRGYRAPLILSLAITSLNNQVEFSEVI